MIITHHREKLINSAIYFATNTNYCGKTKLIKLLYFLDFIHFKRVGRSVTGMDYFAWDKGPVPTEFYEEISNGMKPDLKKAIGIQPCGTFLKICTKGEFDGQYFSRNEMKLLEELSYVFKDAKAEEMVKSTHMPNDPWDRTKKEKGMFKKIDYMLAINDLPDSLPYEEAKKRMTEHNEMIRIFGEA